MVTIPLSRLTQDRQEHTGQPITAFRGLLRRRRTVRQTTLSLQLDGI